LPSSHPTKKSASLYLGDFWIKRSEVGE